MQPVFAPDTGYHRFHVRLIEIQHFVSSSNTFQVQHSIVRIPQQNLNKFQAERSYLSGTEVHQRPRGRP